MNDFERRQEEKRQRLLDRADKKDNEATGRFQRAHDLVKDIPFGQPILVGHHSEARHRRSLDRSHNAMGKGVALSDEAKRLRGRAAAVGTGGINSDDPSALQQLSARLAKLEENQNAMKRINRQYRKGGWVAVEGLTDAERETAKAAMQADWRSDPKPFESYLLSNNNANIRRIRLRIKELAMHRAIRGFQRRIRRLQNVRLCSRQPRPRGIRSTTQSRRDALYASQRLCVFPSGDGVATKAQCRRPARVAAYRTATSKHDAELASFPARCYRSASFLSTKKRNYHE